MPMLRRLWRDWIRPHWRLLLANYLAVIVLAGATAIYPQAISHIIDTLSLGANEGTDLNPLASAAGGQLGTPELLEGVLPQSLPGMWMIILLIIGATFLKGASLYASKLINAHLLARIETDLQNAMYHRLIEADLARIARESATSLATRFTTDITLTRNAVEKLVTALVRDVLMVIGLIGAMISIDWELSLIALMVFPIAIVPLAEIGRRLRRIAKRTQEQVGMMASGIQESLAGIRLAKTYRIEPYLKKRSHEQFETLRGLKVKAASKHGMIDPMMEILGGIAVAAVLYFVGARIAAGENTLGDIMGFITALMLAAQPLRALGNLNAVVQQGLAGTRRIFAILDESPQITEKPDAKPLVTSAGAVQFDRARFSYVSVDESGNRQQVDALRDFSLAIAGGERVAIVGRSGAGKSTIFNLVPRLYDVTGGALRIDGQDIRDVTLASLRDAIAVVSQESILFDDTIRANIGFGRPGASEEDILAAARAAAAHHFITTLPQGYDTPVGEGGQRLSGGQRQRIAIARAFLRDAPILLLDEATSALDAEAEQRILATLDRLAKGRTTLIIAHRLSTILDADQIAVMDQGELVELGTHAQLLAKGGLYASLYRMQFGGTDRG
ncbi:MAG: ABC transporter ATP-binding protein/permease [Neomegalonema sp.]|nr:ABC transporter ATP-binding protein/permease [Neomegalonema sp.]